MEKIKIGTIYNTVGLKGEVKVKSYSDFNDVRFKVGNTLYVNGDENKPVVVHSYRESKGIVLVSFKNLQDINLIESYKGFDLFMNRSDLKDDGDGFYYFDLMGCEVYDQDNNKIGIVTDILESGANPILRVNQKTLIPFVPSFIKAVDIINKRIDIEVIEGLL